MSQHTGKRRGNCAGCTTRCRARPIETQWHFGEPTSAYWQWAARLLCPSCRAAQKDFWFGKRAQDAGVQLRLLSDADAPLVLLSEARLSPADLQDLATVRAAASPARSATRSSSSSSTGRVRSIAAAST